MRARQLIEGSTFAPDELRVIQQTFDQAWETAAATIGSDPAAIDDARHKLARGILAAASVGVREPEALFAAGLLSIGIIHHTPARSAGN